MNKIDLKDILQENLADDNQDYLSILGDEKEMLNDHTDIPDTLPILPLRNTVLFPGVIIPINIGREKSLLNKRTRSRKKTKSIMLSERL